MSFSDNLYTIQPVLRRKKRSNAEMERFFGPDYLKRRKSTPEKPLDMVKVGRVKGKTLPYLLNDWYIMTESGTV